jgi:hypothetical protein
VDAGVRSRDAVESRARDEALRLNTDGMCVIDDCALLNRRAVRVCEVVVCVKGVSDEAETDWKGFNKSRLECLLCVEIGGSDTCEVSDHGG